MWSLSYSSPRQVREDGHHPGDRERMRDFVARTSLTRLIHDFRSKRLKSPSLSASYFLIFKIFFYVSAALEDVI